MLLGLLLFDDPTLTRELELMVRLLTVEGGVAYISLLIFESLLTVLSLG